MFTKASKAVSSAVDNAADYVVGNEFVGRVVSINGKSLVVDRLIASGGFAQVFLVKVPNTAQTYALKKVFTQDRDTMKAIVQEVDLMVSTSSLFIEHFFDW